MQTVWVKINNFDVLARIFSTCGKLSQKHIIHYLKNLYSEASWLKKYLEFKKTFKKW